MKLGIRSKPTLLLATLATAALLLSACTAKVIPIPVPVPMTAAGGAAAAAPVEALPHRRRQPLRLRKHPPRLPPLPAHLRWKA